jgi:hypothetical protein
MKYRCCFSIVIASWCFSHGALNHTIDWIKEVRIDASDSTSVFGNDIIMNKDGSVFIAGLADIPVDTTRYGKAQLVKCTREGEVAWKHTFLDGYLSEANCLCATSDGRILVAGKIKNAESFSNDYWYSLYTADNRLVWTKTFGGPEESGWQSEPMMPNA